MKFKPNYIIIPLITILVALLGTYFTNQGMSWYNTELIRPEITPPKWAFPVAWNIIFILTTIAALLIWNKGKTPHGFFASLLHKKGGSRYHWAITLLILNAILNVGWTCLFFGQQMILESWGEMILLEMTLLILIVISWKISKTASILLIPYTLWVALATYLTYEIIILNF
ncbi:hypothetical protein GF366_00045 [Candidatus Peregrinibacteria bacterium]|nr:hypothetical protein [Candidatus Peregrinibacteria bacterium]